MSIWARLVNGLRKKDDNKPEETKPDWVKKAEAECKIKSKVEFRKACRKAGIPDDWFSYTYDKSKPVCFDGNSVYYGEYGATNCSVPMAMWDVAYEQLIKYKNEYEWRQTEQPFKIDWVTIRHKWWIPGAESDEYPYVKVTTSTMTDEPDEELLADASRQAMKGCPASDNYMDSRSNTVIEENFELAYEEAGLERKRRPSVKEINDVFGNKKTV